MLYADFDPGKPLIMRTELTFRGLRKNHPPFYCQRIELPYYSGAAEFLLPRNACIVRYFKPVRIFAAYLKQLDSDNNDGGSIFHETKSIIPNRQNRSLY